MVGVCLFCMYCMLCCKSEPVGDTVLLLTNKATYMVT